MPEPVRQTVAGALRRPAGWLAAAWLCTGIALAGPLPDQRSQDIGAQLAALETALAAGGRPVADAIAAVGLADLVRPAIPAPRPEPPLPVPVAAVAPEVQLLNMRLGLTMLSQAYGTDDNAAVVAAQAGGAAGTARALVIRSGTVTLAGLARILAEHRLAAPAAGPGLVLPVPLILLAEARLRLGPGETLTLSRVDGAFVVNFGTLEVQGATIAASTAINTGSPGFVPFVTTADSGTVQMRGGRVTGLGFGDTLKFAGFAIIRSGLQTPHQPSVIADSRFDAVMSLALGGADGVVLRGNRFHDMRGAALIVARSRDVAVLSNLFSGAMRTNAIRLEDGAAGGVIAGNIVLGGQRAGITVRNASTGVRIGQNIIWRRNGSGITLSKSDCALVVDNVLIGNRQKGIEVRQSRGTLLRANMVLDNHSAGIWISAQPPGTLTTLQDNVLEANGAGLEGAGGEMIALEGNDFSGQFQQFLGGDLALQSAAVARNMTGQVPMVLTTAEQPAAEAPAPVCAG